MKILRQIQQLDVYFNHYGTRQLCGRLQAGRHSSAILFEYAPSFLQSNIWLLPFTCSGKECKCVFKNGTSYY